MVLDTLGLELERIKELLGYEDTMPTGILLRRVFEINDSISGLKTQQRAILELLEADGSLKVGRAALSALHDIGQAAGISEANSKDLHAAFETNAPAEHRRLLALLGFSGSDVDEFLAALRKKP
ncbi:MAG: hypothetical protein E4H20_02595 [Spirochaetales bacterium]|nr:MAG: hypothetical protein E4H20_02595 [Spirochaetales bacterium]